MAEWTRCVPPEVRLCWRSVNTLRSPRRVGVRTCGLRAGSESEGDDHGAQEAGYKAGQGC